MKSRECLALECIQDLIDSYHHDDLSDFETLRGIEKVLNTVDHLIRRHNDRPEIYFEE